MRPRIARVREKWQETQDTFSLELEPWDDRSFPTFSPGQFNMIYAFGIGEIALSISGSRNQEKSIQHTVRGVGAASRAICRLERGDALGVRGPFGRGWPLQEAVGSEIVVVAGGIGLAPLRPLLDEIVAGRHLFGRVRLLYGTRTPEEILYGAYLEDWSANREIEVQCTVDQGTRDWSGEVGTVTTLIPKLEVDFDKTMAFICGPEVMMRYTAFELEKQGLSGKKIFISMERNMKCALGLCGRCQFGPRFVCKDGPVFQYIEIEELLKIREV